MGFTKLDTDGLVIGNLGRASAGGLLRDSSGTWICEFSHNLGVTNSLEAEFWGLGDRLFLARDLNISKLIVEIDAKAISKLIVEIDAKAIVDLINPMNVINMTSHPYSALINDCRYLIQAFEEARLQHAHRESNFYADLLAKEGNKIIGSYVSFNSPPLFVVNQLLADILGVAYPHML